MKVLLDECLPKRFAELLPGHEVRTTRQMNWHGLSNGKLLSACDLDFDVFITVDKNLIKEQDLQQRRVAVIVLRARSNKIEDLSPLAAAVLAILQSVKPSTVSFVG